MKTLFDQYGVDVVEAVADELIQPVGAARAGAAALSCRTASWQAREYVDMPGGSCSRSADGDARRATRSPTTSPAPAPRSSSAINCCYWATWGAMFAPIFPLLAWDVTWNEGVTRPIRLIAPEGTVVNCVRPAPISIATVGTIQIVNNLSTLVLSKMFGASEPVPRPRHRGLARQPRPRGDAWRRRRRGVLRLAADGHVCRGRGRACVSRRRRPRRRDPERRLALGERREPGAEYAARLSLPACGARTRAGPASSAAASVTSTPSRRTGRRRRARTDAVRQGHARADEPRPLRRLPGLQRRLLHVPAARTSTTLPAQPRRDRAAPSGSTSSGGRSTSSRAISSTSASWAAAATATPSTATPKPCARTSSSDSSARRRHRTSTASSSPTAESTLRRRDRAGERSGSRAHRATRRDGERASTFRRAGFGSRSISSTRPAARRSARSAAASSRLRMRGGRSTPSFAA